MAKRSIYYDTETTGISSEQDRIIEIALYDATNKKTLISFIQPGCTIPAQATAIHGITDAMIAQAPPFAKIAAQMIEFCGDDSVLIAHNNDNFDVLFLRKEFARANLPFPEWQFIDSLKWARRYRPDLPKHSLQFLREIYAFKANQAHRALDDVMILCQIFEIMIGDLPIETVAKLLYQPTEAAAGRANQTVLDKMPFGKHQGKLFSEVPPHYLKWMYTSGLLDKGENGALKNTLLTLGLIQI